MTRPSAPVRRRLGDAAPFLVVAAAAAALTPVPLYNRLGFEFASASGILLLLCGGFRAAGAAAAARRAASEAGGAPFPGGALARVSAGNLSLLAAPLGVAAVWSAIEPPCDAASGLRFYAVLAAPSLLWGTLFGFVSGLAFRRGRAAFAVWLAIVAGAGVFWLLAHPPKFSYNPIVGYFPGPVYDTHVPLDATLVTARASVVLDAVAALALAVLAWNGRALAPARIVRDLRGERAAVAVLLAPAVVVAVLLHVFAAPLGTRIDRGFIQRTLGGHIETPHVRLVYDRGTFSPQRAAALAREHEARWAQLEAFFGFAPARPVGSYVYASPAQKKRLMGAGATSFEDALHDEFHIHASSDDPHPVLMHEMAHIFAAQFDPWIPVSWKMGLHEGIAVAAEWADESARLEMTPHEASAAMAALGLLPDIERTLSAFGFWTQPGARAYTACGSFVRDLVDTHGMQRFRELWRRGDFERAYGEPLAALVAAWRGRLAAIEPSPEQLRRAARLFGPGSIFTARCAREVAALEREAAARAARGDAGGAESTWARVVALDPGDATARIEWARARFAAGDTTGCIEAALALAAEPDLARERDRALRLAGDAMWAQGRFARADSAFAAGERLASGTAERRAFQVARRVLADPRLAPVLRPALAEAGASEGRALAALASGRIVAPDSPWPRYLLGRRLWNAGDPAAARAELEGALGAGGLGREAEIAARELVLRASFAIADGSGDATALAAASQGFEDAARAPDLPAWRRLALLDWAFRARFAAGAAR